MTVTSPAQQEAAVPLPRKTPNDYPADGRIMKYELNAEAA